MTMYRQFRASSKTMGLHLHLKHYFISNYIEVAKKISNYIEVAKKISNYIEVAKKKGANLLVIVGWSASDPAGSAT